MAGIQDIEMNRIDSSQQSRREGALETGVLPDQPNPQQGSSETASANDEWHQLFNDLQSSRSLHEHLLKMSFPAVRDPACRTIEVWPGWATYLRYSKSLKLNKLGSKLWAAIVSGDDAERELLEDKFFAMLMEYYRDSLTIEQLENKPKISDLGSMSAYLSHLENGIRPHLSAKEMQHLNLSATRLSSQTMRSERRAAHAFLSWGSKALGSPIRVRRLILSRSSFIAQLCNEVGRDGVVVMLLTSSIQKVFKGEVPANDDQPIHTSFEAKRADQIFIALGYLVLALWFSVPVGILGSDLVSPAGAIMLYIFFVLTASAIMTPMQVEPQNAIVATVGYGALLSSIIFR